MAAAAPEIPAGLGAAGLIATAAGWAVLTLVLWAYRRSIYALAIGLANQFDRVSVSVSRFHFRPLAPVSGALRHTAKAVEAALAEAALGCEHATVWLAQQVWQMLLWQARELADLAVTVEKALGLQRVVDLPKVIRAAVAPVLTRLHGIDRLVGRIEAQAQAQWARLHRGIDRIEGIATKTIPKAIGRVTTRVGHLEKTVAGLRGHAGAIERLLGATAIATLVAAALGRLGLRWLRCGNVKRVGKAVCGMNPAWLTLALSETFEAMLVLDLCRFALAAQRLARLVVPQLGVLLLVQDAVCMGGGATLPSAADEPRTTLRIALPSAHD